MVIGLHRNPFMFECLIDPDTMLGHDIPIIESMRHQSGCLKWTQLIEVISASPKIIVVTMDPVHAFSHGLVADGRIAELSSLRIAAVNEVVEAVNVFPDVASGVSDQAMATIIVVIGSIWGNGYDGFKPLDPSGGCSQWQGPIVRSARHAYLAR